MTEGNVVKVKMLPNAVSQLSDLSWSGIAEIHWGTRQIGVYVHARSKVEDRSDEARENWARKLVHAVATHIDSVSAFQENDLTYWISPEVPAEEIAECPIGSAQLAQLDLAYEHIGSVRQDFKAAVAKLREFGESPPSHGVRSDSHDMYRYLQICLIECGYLGVMHTWYREKMSGILRAIHDIERRKDRNHHGFRLSQTAITQPLFSFEVPRAWLSRPPRLT